MRIRTFPDRRTMGLAAADHAARTLRRTIDEAGSARIIAATGTSQFEFLEALTTAAGIDWQRVEMFHLDEYVGLPADHPASFRKYLLERLINRTDIVRHHLLDGSNPASTAESTGREIRRSPIDLAFVGIGENGHLAFNDPPADFETEEPYLVVTLDDGCRRQQVGEGWFGSVREVPEQAISMSVRQILKSREIICLVPDARKAKAVKATLEGGISPMTPASILRTHSNTTFYLDRESSALLDPAARG